MYGDFRDNLFDSSLEQLDQLEGNSALEFEKLNAEIAWDLGVFAREYTKKNNPGKSVIIDVALATGQVLFRTSIGKGTNFDNDFWVERKKKMVNRTGKSSFYNGQKLRIKGVSLEEGLMISSTEFATHGGSVPIRVKGNDYHVATLTISGLKQEDDHLLAIDILTAFNK